MSALQLRSSKAVVAVLMVVGAMCASTFFASAAQASPPRYIAVMAGPGGQYPQSGFYDTYDQSVQPQCSIETTRSTVLGPTTDMWLRITYRGVTGYVVETPFNGLTPTENTPVCPAPSATCVSSGFQNSIVQWPGPGKQNTSWYVTAYCTRQWIPDVKTYWCLRDAGVVDKGVQPAAVLDSLTDQWGVRIKCYRDTPGVVFPWT
jgi:hypothetical protein